MPEVTDLCQGHGNCKFQKCAIEVKNTFVQYGVDVGHLKKNLTVPPWFKLTVPPGFKPIMQDRDTELEFGGCDENQPNYFKDDALQPPPEPPVYDEDGGSPDPASRKKKNRRRGVKKQGRGHITLPQNSDRHDLMAADTQATDDGSRFCKNKQLQAEADESMRNELFEQLQPAIKLFALDVAPCSVVQAILNLLDKGDESTRNELIEKLLPAMKLLALDVEGSRMVQAILGSLNVSQPLMSKIVEALVDNFKELYESRNGNHVLQACVSKVPSFGLAGMIRKVEGNARTVARHVFGCRVLERFFEHFSVNELDSVMKELAVDAYSLCRHPSGNFVIQHMLEYVRGSHEIILRDMLIGGMPFLASHRTASHLVQKALDQCDIYGKHQIVEALLKGEGDESLVNVAISRYGSFVIQHLEGLSREKCSVLVADVEAVKGVLRNQQTILLSTDAGRRVAECFRL